MALVSSQSSICFPSITGLPQNLSQAGGGLAVERLAMFAKGTGPVEITDFDLVGGRRAHRGQSYVPAVRLLSSPLVDKLDKSMMGSLNPIVPIYYCEIPMRF